MEFGDVGRAQDARRFRDIATIAIQCRKCGVRMVNRGKPGAGSLLSTQQRLATGQGYGGTHGMQVWVSHASVSGNAGVAVAGC